MPEDETPEQPTRSQFGSRIGFILAAIGSAIGFGSIARFPMNAANNGGAAFVLIYAGIMLLVGIPMMIAEFSLGRSSQRNAVGAFSVLTGEPRTKWRWAGILYFTIAAFFLSWYSIVSGWTLRYFFGSLTGAYFDDPANYFADTATGPDTLFWHFAVMALTTAALIFPVAKGIERVNLFMMPALFAIVIGLALYALTLPNIGPGYEFYLTPDFSAITLGVVTAAVGQAFFSLSLGQGAMMTYASYIPKTSSLASNAALVAGSTLTFATICGFMIFPLLSTFGLLNTGQAGLGLIYGPLALAFSQMGTPVGQIVGSLFFLGTFFAAFTSAVSLAEPAIAYVTEERGVDRRRAALLVCGLIYIAGIAVAFSTDLLDIEGGKLTDMSVILGGLLIALFVGLVSSRNIARQRMDEGVGWKLSWYVYPMVRYVMPVVLAFLFFFSLFGTPCALGGDAGSDGLLETMFGARFLNCA